MSNDLTAFRDAFNKVIREFTEDLKKIADEVTAPKALQPGDRITADTARGLPVGSSFRDSEGDEWYVTDGGFSWSNSRQDFTDLNPEDYEPLTLTSLPEPPADLAEEQDEDEAPEAALADWEKELLGVKPYHVQIGDLVRITAGVNSYQGQVGTVGKLKTREASRHSVTGYRYTLEGSFWYAGDVEKVEETVAEPTPDAAPGRPEVRIGDRVRTIRANLPHRVSEAEGLEGPVANIIRNSDGTIRYVVVAGWGIKEYEVLGNEPEAEPTPDVPAVGDRVKVIRTHYDIVAFRQGQEGTVEAHEDGVPWVRFDDGGKVLASETETVATPEPDTSQLRIVDRDGDVLEVSYMGLYSGNRVAKVHTNRGSRSDFSSVYLTASEVDDLIARLQAFQKAAEDGPELPF